MVHTYTWYHPKFWTDVTPKQCFFYVSVTNMSSRHPPDHLNASEFILYIWMTKGRENMYLLVSLTLLKILFYYENAVMLLTWQHMIQSYLLPSIWVGGLSGWQILLVASEDHVWMSEEHPASRTSPLMSLFHS